jgi:carbonic anhydrase
VRPAAYAPLMFQYRSQPLRAINVGGQVRVLAAPGSELRLRGDAYALEELHFHVPGEHRFQGQSAAGEIHLVHRDALGRRAIVAVPLRAGRRVNSILMRIVERLPAGPGASVQFDRVGINPLFLIPTERDYVSYSGSLETPPCTEPVLWFVMTSALEVDPEQIRRIAQLVGANARPVQPQNGRPVYLARPGR